VILDAEKDESDSFFNALHSALQISDPIRLATMPKRAGGARTLHEVRAIVSTTPVIGNDHPSSESGKAPASALPKRPLVSAEAAFSVIILLKPKYTTFYFCSSQTNIHLLHFIYPH